MTCAGTWPRTRCSSDRMKQIPRLSRAQRMEIKENVTLSLMKKALPMPAVYDMCWNLAENTVLFRSDEADSPLEPRPAHGDQGECHPLPYEEGLAHAGGL